MTDLLAEIVANPDDDALRSVYADQLACAGDPRGELIQIELRLDALSYDKLAERTELAQRRAQLRSEHAARWWPGVAPWQVYTRRGFIDRLTLTKFSTLPAWLAREPIAELQLVLGPKTPLAKVLAELPRVKKLILVKANGKWLVQLAKSPLAPTLEGLQLLDCEAADGRLAKDAFPALDSVRCRGRKQLHAWLEHWNRVDQLEWLDLPGCHITERYLERLVTRARNLRFLNLAYANLASPQSRALLAAARTHMPNIERVELFGCELGDNVPEALQRAPFVLEPEHLESVVIRAPEGMQLGFLHAEDDIYCLFVDGVHRDIIWFVDDEAQPSRPVAPIGLIVKRLAYGTGQATLIADERGLTWAFEHPWGRAGFSFDGEYGPLKIRP